MPYFSKFYKVEVRDEIAKEFTNSKGEVDDMMAGLHEIRVRKTKKKYDSNKLAKKHSTNNTQLTMDNTQRSTTNGQR